MFPLHEAHEIVKNSNDPVLTIIVVIGFVVVVAVSIWAIYDIYKMNKNNHALLR